MPRCPISVAFFNGPGWPEITGRYGALLPFQLLGPWGQRRKGPCGSSKLATPSSRMHAEHPLKHIAFPISPHRIEGHHDSWDPASPLRALPALGCTQHFPPSNKRVGNLQVKGDISRCPGPEMTVPHGLPKRARGAKPERVTLRSGNPLERPSAVDSLGP